MQSFKDPPIFGTHILSPAAATVSLKQKTKEHNMLHIEMCQNICCGISKMVEQSVVCASQNCIPVGGVFNQQCVTSVTGMSQLVCFD